MQYLVPNKRGQNTRRSLLFMYYIAQCFTRSHIVNSRNCLQGHISSILSVIEGQSSITAFNEQSSNCFFPRNPY